MPTMREIKTRRRSIKNIQQITRAIMLTATSRLKKAEHRIISLRPYAYSLLETLSSLALRISEEKRPTLLTCREIKKILLVVVTSERGLCGGFNTNIIKIANAYLKETPTPISLIIIGKKGYNYYKRTSHEIKDIYAMPDKHYMELASRLSLQIVSFYLDCVFDCVVFVYNEFKSIFQQKPIIEKLLPITPMPRPKILTDYIYEPSCEKILEGLLPMYFEIEIYRILLESSAAEQSARMVAMEHATENAGRLLDELTLSFNKARQAMITKELADIIGTAEAVK